MAGPRFPTARALFEAFPSANGDTSAVPTDEALPAFVRALLASATPEDAVTICAYALPPREAVWWAAQCVRALDRIGRDTTDRALLAAEAWVREPLASRCEAAQHAAGLADRREPTTWLALAAAWAGSLAPEPAPPAGLVDALTSKAMTPKAVRTAILAALALVAVRDRSSRLHACVGLGLKMMGAGDDA